MSPLSDLGVESKVFFYSFLLIFCPLNPDQDPGSQNVADPTDPDPKHGFLGILFETSFFIYTEYNACH